MTWTRRRLLDLAAKLGLLSMLPVSVACEEDDDDSVDPWPPFEGCDPETVDWTWEGEVGPETLFSHGVASGDPLPGAVILWTRVSPEGDDEAEVLWEVSTTAGFDEVLASGIATTDGDRDFTVKVDVGCLRPSTTYYYRFQSQGRTSPIGRTRTASYGATESLRFALVSCSNYSAGWFHGYRALAQMPDLELVFHVGDYIYESGGSSARPHAPPGETLTLQDYRTRYAQYRGDLDLQEVHRQHPFVCVWDDHETSNNSWSGGASSHGTGDGPWEERLAAARQAYLEWLPVRDVDGALHRRLQRGDLVDFFVLDTRIEGRDEQSTTQDEAYDPDRQILGEAQEAWLLDGISATRSTWTVLAQQVVMAQWSIAQDAEGRPLPLNRDAWDGYDAARRRIFDRVQAEGRDLVVLTGDVHSSWAHDLATDFVAYNVVTHTGSVGVEAVAPGITSGGGAVDIIDNLAAATPHIRWAESLHRGFVVLHATHDDLQADWHLLPDGAINSDVYVAPVVEASFVVRPGEPWWEEAAGPLAADPGAPPLVP
jgi:alkaline phosphatase D